MKTRTSPPAARLTASAGFTLLEMAVVLAIIMILALVVFSTTLRQLDRIAADKEGAALASYADALQQSILRNGRIPAATNWAVDVAAELGANAGIIATNDRGQTRLFLADRGSPALPYTQGAGGIPTYSNLCFILISSLGPAPLPAVLTNGSYTHSDFTNTWNWDFASTPRPTLWSTYAGNSDDLLVKRINLSPLFVRLLLMNYPLTGAATNQGHYRLGEQGSLITVVTNVDAYFLKNTLVNLVNGDNTPDAQLLTRDANYYYNAGVWSSFPQTQALPTVGMGALMAQTMAEFRTSPRNSNAHAEKDQPKPTPASVADAMDDFMMKYLQWANQSPPFSKSGAYREAAKAANDLLVQQMKNLCEDFKSGECY